jgi:thiol-disulfide isomerase/thioredoxin
MQIGSTFFLTTLKKDESLNICRDTIRHKFSGDTTMITFELIHYLSTDEIQYVWLDENSNRSEKAIIIDIDHPLRTGKMFPDLTVEQLNSEKLSFNDLIGKTVVVNWWHIACAPCIAEMPGLNKLVEQYKENFNVVFVAIVDNKKEHVTPFLESREFDYTQTLANEAAAKLFGNSYPVHVIINSEGKIHNFSRGGGENVHIEIEKILKNLLE